MQVAILKVLQYFVLQIFSIAILKLKLQVMQVALNLLFKKQIMLLFYFRIVFLVL